MKSYRFFIFDEQIEEDRDKDIIDPIEFRIEGLTHSIFGLKTVAMVDEIIKNKRRFRFTKLDERKTKPFYISKFDNIYILYLILTGLIVINSFLFYLLLKK